MLFGINPSFLKTWKARVLKKQGFRGERNLAFGKSTIFVESDFGAHFGNGQLSLIFGVPNFSSFSLLVLCLFKLQVGGGKSAKIRDTEN